MSFREIYVDRFYSRILSSANHFYFVVAFHLKREDVRLVPRLYISWYGYFYRDIRYCIIIQTGFSPDSFEMITLSSSSYNDMPTGTSIQIRIDVKNESFGISQDKTNTNLLVFGIFATIVAIILYVVIPSYISSQSHGMLRVFLNVYRIRNNANRSPMLEPDPVTRLELFAQLVPKKTYGDCWMSMQREQQSLVNSNDSIHW